MRRIGSSDESVVRPVALDKSTAVDKGGVYPNVPNGTVRVTNYVILRDFQTHEFRSDRVNFPTF